MHHKGILPLVRILKDLDLTSNADFSKPALNVG